MGRVRRTLALAGVLAMAGSLGACQQQSKKCDFRTGEYGVCTIDTTGGGSSVDLGFHIDPAKSGNDFNDSYLFRQVEGGVASFSVMGQDFSCTQGETIPVGKGFADCLEVGEDHLKVRIYVGDPPRQ